jgi:hypothetical protein
VFGDHEAGDWGSCSGLREIVLDDVSKAEYSGGDLWVKG